jgi:DNA adenine methylase
LNETLVISYKDQPSNIQAKRKNNRIEPFLKWAGGKRWFVQKYSEILPKKFKTYIEPFLGSGAVFFYLQPQQSILSDTNEELISTYLAIKNDWKVVYKNLRLHHFKHSNDYYYKIRSSKPRSDFANAARLIYLNRTCWNGLYRVNLNGEFNVPKGTKNDVLLRSDNFELYSKLLSKSKIVVSDFEKIIENAEKGDLIFADPPYTVKHGNNGFIKYNESLFAWQDQIRLYESLKAAHERGVKFLLTNAKHESVIDLYKNRFALITLSRSSIIAAKKSHRGKIKELVIKNF